MATLTWKPEPGKQTKQLRAVGLNVDDLRAAGYVWTKAQQWEAQPSPEASKIIDALYAPRQLSLFDQELDEQEPVRNEPPKQTTEHVKEKPWRERDDSGRLSVLAGKAKTIALRLEMDAQKGERDREENTPKRAAQAGRARQEAARFRRASEILMKYHAEPAKMPGWTPNKADAIEAARQKMSDAYGYYGVSMETGEPAQTTNENAKALREAYGINLGKVEETPKQKAKRLEEGLRFSPIPGFFPTPASVIEQMIERADLGQHHRILEPSAGKGDILDAVFKWYQENGGTEYSAKCCEVHCSLREILTTKGHTVIAEDFTELPETEKFDRIIANPPFERGQDRDHIRKMFGHLAIGGKMVSLCSTGPFFRSNKADVEFREWLEGLHAEVEELGPGAFSGSDAFRQTGVSVNMITIHN